MSSLVPSSLKSSYWAPPSFLPFPGPAGQSCTASQGDVWGEDAILSRQHLRDLVPVRSLCYFEVLSLQVAALRTALVDHPTEAARVRWAAVQLAFCRAVKKVAAVAGDRIGMSDLPMELRLSLITDILTNAPLSGRRRAVRNASFMSTGCVWVRRQVRSGWLLSSRNNLGPVWWYTRAGQLGGNNVSARFDSDLVWPTRLCNSATTPQLVSDTDWVGNLNHRVDRGRITDVVCSCSLDALEGHPSP